ncbi:hypothetical protein ER70_05355 [Borreliella bissettiae]|uniref:Uncharacterized protein n=1 Tax=Borrelia bissettiae TaxID=64897 RepID=A0A1L8ZB84_BORBI|nr:hypothetical protein ER70_05355 [Borreliella bissettiae]
MFLKALNIFYSPLFFRINFIIIKLKINITNIKINEIADPVFQSSIKRNCLLIRFPIKICLEPPSKSEMINTVIEGINTIIIPVAR